jgi:protein LSM14
MPPPHMQHPYGYPQGAFPPPPGPGYQRYPAPPMPPQQQQQQQQQMGQHPLPPLPVQREQKPAEAPEARPSALPAQPPMQKPASPKPQPVPVAQAPTKPPANAPNSGIIPKTELPERLPLAPQAQSQTQPKTNGAPQPNLAPASFAQAAAGRSPVPAARSAPTQINGSRAAQPQRQPSVSAGQVEQLASDMNRMRPPSGPSRGSGRGGRGGLRVPSGPRPPSQTSAPAAPMPAPAAAQPAQPDATKPLPEFDFESATARFEKVAEGEKAQAQHQGSTDGFYQKSSSFFDTISSELNEGAKDRFDRRAEANKNADTFGEECVRCLLLSLTERLGRARSMRPAGRGFRGRGRGRGGRGRGAPRGGAMTAAAA